MPVITETLPASPEVADAQVRAHTGDDAYREALRRHMPYIVQWARLLAREEEDLAEELFQVGRIALWKHDPSRYAEEHDAFVRQRIGSALLHARRWEVNRRRVPLVDRAGRCA